MIGHDAARGPVVSGGRGVHTVAPFGSGAGKGGNMPMRLRYPGWSALLAVLILLAPVASPGAAEDGKRADIREILAITGAQRNATAMIDLSLPQIMEIIRKANPGIPPEVVDEFRREGRDEFVKSLPEFIEQMVKLYDAAYSSDEIKQLLTFYKSPLGQKMIAQTPRIMQEGMAIGQGWGRRIGQRVVERIRRAAKQKGYDL